MPDRLSLAADLYTRRRCRCLPLHGVLRLCIFQTALKNTFLWYYFLTLERAGKDMVSLGGSERIAEEYLIKIFEALFCAITILS